MRAYKKRLKQNVIFLVKRKRTALSLSIDRTLIAVIKFSVSIIFFYIFYKRNKYGFRTFRQNFIVTSDDITNYVRKNWIIILFESVAKRIFLVKPQLVTHIQRWF